MTESTLINEEEVEEGRNLLIELDKKQQESWKREGFDYSQISRGSWVLIEIELLGREKCFSGNVEANELRKFLTNLPVELQTTMIPLKIRNSILKEDLWRNEGKDLLMENWEYLPELVKIYIRSAGEIEWMNRRRELLENYESLEESKKVILRNGFIVASEISKLVKDVPVNYTKLAKALEGKLSKREISVALDSFLLDFMFIQYYTGISNPGEKEKMASTGLIKFTN